VLTRGAGRTLSRSVLGEEVLGDRRGVLLVDVDLLDQVGEREVSSLADTALRAAVSVSLTLSLRTSGTTLSEPKSSLGSSSVTKPFAAIDGSVLKMLAACAWPPIRASTIALPLSGRKSFGTRLYCVFRPARPWARVPNSGGAATVTSPWWRTRSTMDFSDHLAAVSLVTTIEFLSSAADLSRTTRSGGRVDLTAV